MYLFQLAKKTLAVEYYDADNRICIKPTMRCNLKCPYCSVALSTGKRPEFKESTLDEWIDLLDTMDFSVLTISGGEPLLYPQIYGLLNYLKRRKCRVNMLTNLTVTRKLPRNWKMHMTATYHRQSSLEKFKKNLKYYRKRFPVGVHELVDENNKDIYFHNSFILANDHMIRKIETEQCEDRLTVIAPDLSIYNSYIEMEAAG